MRLLIAFTFLAMALAGAPARAAQSYDNCTGFIDALPAVISTQGTWCLRRDLATAITSGVAIHVNANNVTLDCNHFKLGGLAAGAGTAVDGVMVSTQTAFTMRHCNVRGFRIGLWVYLGDGHLVENNRFEGNTIYGILLSAHHSTVRGNHVLDTGGAPDNPSITYAMALGGEGNVALDNIITGVDALAPDGNSGGIYFSGQPGGSIGRNTISGLDTDTSGYVFGIFLSSGHAFIYENTTLGTGTGNGSGIHCPSNQSIARANMTIGFVNGVVICLSSSNVVNPN